MSSLDETAPTVGEGAFPTSPSGSAATDVAEPLHDVLSTVVSLLEGRAGALVLEQPPAGEERVVARVWRHADATVTADTDGSAGGSGEIVQLPVVTLAGETIGHMRVLVSTGPPDARQRELAGAFARQAAELVQHSRLHREAGAVATREQRRVSQLRELAQTAMAMGSAQDVDEVLRVATQAACAIVGARRGTASRSLHGRPEAIAHASPDTHAPDRPAPTRVLAVPLVGADGRRLGSIEVADKADGSGFNREDEEILIQLAQLVSARVENEERYQLERRARELAESRERRQRLLAQASHAFTMSVDVEQTLDTLTRIVVPEFADWCGVELVGADGRVRLDASASLREDLDADVRGLLGWLPPGVRLAAAPAVVRTGRGQLYPDVSDEEPKGAAGGELAVSELTSLGVRSALVAPLPGRGSTIGAVTLVRVQGAAYTTEDLEFVEDLSRRAALAVENATRVELERQAADMLQRMLLPRALPRNRRLWCAGRYRAGTAGLRVGGDWYDLIDLGGDRVILVVGDVMGHGVRAAATMAQLRSAVRAYASEGHPPAALLERVDALARSLGDAHVATCLAVALDTTSGRLAMATAGHPPPLLVTADGHSRFLDLEPGLPLGLDVGAADYAQQVGDLPRHATLLLYTDGLVESREEPVETGMRRLADAAARGGAEPEKLCDHLLAELASTERADDFALLAVQWGSADDGRATSSAAGDEATVSLLMDRRSPGRARAFVREHLRGWSCTRALETAVLLTSELVTNAQLHGREPLVLRVACERGRVCVEVTDGGSQMPVVRDYGADAGTGRGLRMVAELCLRWGVEPLPLGKTVWFEVEC